MGSARYVNNIRANNEIVLELNGTPIEVTDRVINLGLTFTSTLNWMNEQVKAVS